VKPSACSHVAYIYHSKRLADVRRWKLGPLPDVNPPGTKKKKTGAPPLGWDIRPTESRLSGAGAQFPGILTRPLFGSRSMSLVDDSSISGPGQMLSGMGSRSTESPSAHRQPRRTFFVALTYRRQTELEASRA